MTHIPVGKRLPVTEYVPLPQNRPKMTESVPVQDLNYSTDSTMPLERPEKAADALFEGSGYHPSSLDLIDLLEPPRGLVVGFNWWKQKWNEMNPFSFGWYEDKHGATVLTIYNHASEVMLFVGALVVIAGVMTGVVLLTEKILEKFNILRKDR